MKKSTFLLLLKSLAAAALLGWFLYRSDVGRVFQTLASLSVLRFFFSTLLIVTAVYVNSIKWSFILPEHPLPKLFQLNLIGQYYSIVLPGQLGGEAAKAYLLGKGQRDAERVLASILFDKITGILGLFLIGIVGLVFTTAALPAGLVWILLIGIAVGVAALFSFRSGVLYGWVSTSLGSLRKRINKLEGFLGRMSRLVDEWHLYSKKPRLLFASILIGAFYQIIGVLINVLLSRGVGIHLGFLDWCWIQAIISLVLLLPITVGGLGVREGSLVGILGWMGIASEKALALSLSLSGLVIIMAVIGGISDYRFALKRKKVIESQ
jgi:uncharacterized protein (TIRG00374 family)